MNNDSFDLSLLDFEKSGGLIPAVVQDANSAEVLMLGYMNKTALQMTLKEGCVTFFSRSKNRLWTKGETSGNYLKVITIRPDCDNDTLLITVLPEGPVCHTGTYSCFGEKPSKGFLYVLEQIISQRINDNKNTSYTNALFNKGINKIAQKVGEEAVELVIEAKDSNDILFRNEAADLLYHLLILLKAKNTSLADIEAVLRQRSR